MKKFILLIVIFFLINCLLIVNSLDVNAHSNLLTVDYDECIPGDDIAEKDEVWYYLCETNYSQETFFDYFHIGQNITTIKYYFEDASFDGSGYTWTTDIDEELANNIKTAYVESMKKWNDVYYYSYDDNGNMITHKIINIVEGTKDDHNLSIYPLEHYFGAPIASTGNMNSGEDIETNISNITHRHISEFYMNINIRYFYKDTNAIVNDEELEVILKKTGMHEVGHILGLDDIDVCCISGTDDHHEEVIMGYGDLENSIVEVTYKDIAGISIIREFHTDDDHTWMRRTKNDGSFDLICAQCNGVLYNVELEDNNTKYMGEQLKVYQDCIHHSDSSTNCDMLLVAKDDKYFFYKCQNCRYIEKKLFSEAIDIIDEYTFSNWSQSVNKEISLNQNESKYIKFNSNFFKFYQFTLKGAINVDLKLFDSKFNEVSNNDLNSSTAIKTLIEKLPIGTYYLEVYNKLDSVQQVILNIISRNSTFLQLDNNDILINTYNGISEYTYPHNQGPGFYKFKLTAGNITSYPSGAIKVYKDQSRTELLDRFETDMISYSASSNTNENEIYVYIPCNGTYYIDISLNSVDYSSVTMEIEEVELNEPNYSSTLSSPTFNVLFENINKYSYFEKIIVDALSKIQIDVIASGTLNDYVPILLFKEEIDYGSPINNREYYLDTIFIGEVNPIEYIPCYTFILEPGTYYIGYIDNTDKVFMNIALTRLVEYSDNMDSILVADPYYTGYDLGTEVLFNYGECNTYTITEGFTRNIYLMVEDRLRDPMSRLEYEWYSSNESVATVSSYGTVLARQVEIDTTVKIFAVLKEDPSIVYFKEFTILNDEEEELIEIELDMSYSYSAENGTYQLELTNTNCPYPMIQYYDWNIVNENEGTVSINYWGQVTATSPCSCVIIGTYKLNPRVKIIINLSII